MKWFRRCFKLQDSRPGDGESTQTSASAAVSAGSDDEHTRFTLKVRTFRFSELSAATANFSRNRQIGSGSSGQVYEGQLSWFGKVAVKWWCFDESSRRGIQQRKNEFLKEVYVLNSMDHPNIVKLIGCCSKGEERLLVYEYMPMGTLRECLSDVKTWIGIQE